MTQVSHHIAAPPLPESADQLNRCLKIANQVQSQFIQSSNSRTCFERLLRALCSETGSKAGFIADLSEDLAQASLLRMLAATGGMTTAGPGDDVWTTEVGAAVSLPDGPLRRAIDTAQTVVDSIAGSSRLVLAIPIHNDGSLVGLIGLTGSASLHSDITLALAPLLQASGVLIDAAHRQRRAQNEQRDSQISASMTASQVWLQAILNHDPDYIVSVNRDGKILSVNRTVAESNVDSVVGSTIYDYQPPEFRKTSQTMLRRVFEDGEVVAMESFGGLDPNSERYVRVRAIPLKIDGQVESAVLIGTDITEQKKVLEETEQQESLLNALVEGTSEFMFAKDRDSRIVFCNSGAARMYGLTPQETVGIDESDFFPDTVARRIREVEIRIMTSGTSETYEENLPSESGDRVLLTTKSPWRDKVGRIIGIVGMAQDITEQTRAQRALASSEARLRTIIDSEPACVCLIATDGTLLDINSSGLSMIEATSKKQTRGVRMESLIAQECRGEFRELHRRACSGETCDAHFEVVGLNGTRRTVEHHAVPFQYSPDETIHLGITRDITEQRKAEETVARQQGQLVHVSRLSTMGQMVAVISHEITQPLSAISNFAAACSLLLDQPDTGSTVEKHIASIQQQSERAGNIITRIRDFAKRSEPHRSTCDLRALIADALELIRADLRRRSVTVEFHRPEPGLLGTEEPPLLVLADHVQIQQVVLNLVSNACDAMAHLPVADRRLWIRCWKKSSLEDSDSFISRAHARDDDEDDDDLLIGAIVEVTDNGPGLDSNSVLHLFDPFYTSKPQGMGLGLSICRDIVKSHQGTMQAGNKHKYGARFRFMLPCGGGNQ
jgi:PAS domain S-box-containing protein